MGLIAKKRAAVEIPPLEAGTYTAICIGIVDLGEQLNTVYKKYQDTVSLTFEFVDETIERGNGPEPRWISKEYTKTLGEKSNLYHDLNAWLGELSDEQLESFDISNLLNRGCLAAVKVKEGSDGRKKNTISGVMALPKGMPKPVSKSQPFLFNMDDESTYPVLQTIPQFLRDKVEKSTNWARKQAGNEEMTIEEDESAEEAAVPRGIDPDTGEILRMDDEPAF